MNWRIALPNIFTAANLLSGFTAVLLIFEGHSQKALFAILAAAFFDVIDGLVARFLKGQSEFGKQFDSLSDLVSFGIVPAILMAFSYSSNQNNFWTQWYMSFLPASLFVVAVAIRLAWFNSDSSQKTDFKGMASPAAGIAVMSLMLYYFEYCDKYPLFLWLVAAIFSSLMLIPVRVLSLKFTKSRLHLIFSVLMALLAIGLLTYFGFKSLWLVVLLYYFLGIFFFRFSRRHDERKL